MNDESLRDILLATHLKFFWPEQSADFRSCDCPGHAQNPYSYIRKRREGLKTLQAIKSSSLSS